MAAATSCEKRLKCALAAFHHHPTQFFTLPQLGDLVYLCKQGTLHRRKAAK